MYLVYGILTLQIPGYLVLFGILTPEISGICRLELHGDRERCVEFQDNFVSSGLSLNCNISGNYKTRIDSKFMRLQTGIRIVALHVLFFRV